MEIKREKLENKIRKEMEKNPDPVFDLTVKLSNHSQHIFNTIAWKIDSNISRYEGRFQLEVHTRIMFDELKKTSI